MAEEKAPTAPRWGPLRLTVAAVAVAMSVYHMYVAGFGPPEAMIFRGTHLLFALTLVFLLYPLRPGASAGWFRRKPNSRASARAGSCMAPPPAPDRLPPA